MKMEAKNSRIWLIKMRGDMTQQLVADKAGISRSYYAEIETGTKNPSVAAAKRLGMAMGFDWVIFFEDGCRTMHPETLPAQAQ